MKKIFLISGKSCSGKDTVGNIIKQQLYDNNQHNRILIIHFGDLVKYFAKKFYEWNGEKDEHGRALLQKLGTEQLRKHFPNYWAEVVAQFVKAVEYDWDYVIIPDWRFINEYEVIFNYFQQQLITINVIRMENGNLYVNPLMTKTQLSHASETELDTMHNYNYIIYNQGGLEDLVDSIDIILKETLCY